MSKVTVNIPAPEFVLDDFRGQQVSLSGFRDNKHVVLVFNRGLG